MRNIISRRAADLTQNIQKTNKNTPRRKLIHSFRGRKGLFYFHGVRTGANFSYKKQCKGRTCSVYESSSIYLSVSPILQSPIQESVYFLVHLLHAPSTSSYKKLLTWENNEDRKDQTQTLLNGTPLTWK